MYHKSEYVADATPSPNNPLIATKALLYPGVVPGINKCIQATFPAGIVAKKHKHDDIFEVFVINSGSGEVLIDDTIVALKPSDLVIIEPGEYHEFRNTGNDNMVMTYFTVSAKEFISSERSIR